MAAPHLDSAANGLSAQPNESGPGAADLPLLIGLGGGEGSQDALCQLFGALNTRPGATFIITSTLSSADMAAMLARVSTCTPLPCVPISSGLAMQVDTIYWTSISAAISLERQQFHVHTWDPAATQTLQPCNNLFHAIADAAGEQALGIVLSGAGNDGIEGLKYIKERGGLTLVQDPASALYSTMPHTALASGLIDYSLAPADMAALILRYAQSLPSKAAQRQPIHAPLDSIERLLALLQRKIGYDFRPYKRSTIKRRIERRLGLHRINNIDEYLRFAEQQPDELEQLFRDLLISVTMFFRDPEAFQILDEHALSELVRAHPPERPLRVWVPACATGEEAYSLAISLLELLEAYHKPCPLQIFATDVNATALDFARQGEYPASSASDVSPQRLRQFFTFTGETYRINKQVRDCVAFAVHNLTVDPPFSKLDLISCRNVLIYLDPAVQKQVVSLFHFALNPNGILFLGNAETIGIQENLFATLSKKWRIYQRTGTASRMQFTFRAHREGAELPRTSDFTVALPHKATLTSAVSQLLLNRFVPTTVLINQQFECLYVHNPLGADQSILMIPSGAPTQDLLALVGEELRAPLRVAVARAQREQRRTSVNAMLRSSSGLRSITIAAQPLQDAQLGNPLLVSFLENSTGTLTERVIAEPAPLDASLDPVTRQLEYELAMAREDLQNTIEELAASNEDLTAINEEMASMNEELQSTNEELETSKEELQSLNEELIAINLQLQDKVAELETTSNDLLNLLSSSAIATLFLDLRLNIKRFTPSITELFNLLPNDLGRPLTDITRHFQEPDLVAAVRGVIATLQPNDQEIQHADGRWFIRRILPYRTVDQRIEGVVITFTDISELKRIEHALRQSEQRFSTALHNSSITVFEQDRNLQYTWIYNPALGMDTREIVGKTDADLFENPVDVARLNELKRAVLESGRGQHQEVVITQNGRPHVFDMAIEPIRAGGAIQGITCVVSDVTKRSQLEEERLQLLQRAETARGEAEKAVQLRNVFLSIASHELKTPLTALLGNAYLLNQRMQRGQPIDERSQRFASTVVAQAERLNALITLLLDVSRIDSGTLRLNLQPVDIGALVAQAIQESAPRTTIHDIRFQPPAQPLLIEGDPVRLHQVLLNLLNNAIKYSPHGGPVDVEIFQQQSDVGIAISDRGIGIPVEAQEHIFEQFYRAANTEMARIQGMGIGLFVVRQIVRLHGGSLHVRSRLGIGSTFTVYLPVLTG